MSNGMRSCAQGVRENNQHVTPLEKSDQWSLTELTPFIHLFHRRTMMYSPGQGKSDRLYGGAANEAVWKEAA